VASRFTQLLQAHYSDKRAGVALPTVTHLADDLHMSPRYLSDLLKAETGKTAIELIHIFLISEAKNMLMINNTSITETAYALGFENLPYFSRLFKRETGVSPNKYRKQGLFGRQYVA
jgi:AraC-like DNA-binding protein